MEKDDSASRAAVAYTFQAVNRRNSDRLKAHAEQTMPLVFLALHEDNNDEEDTKDIWEEVWSDCTPGTEGGVRIHLKGILALTKAASESSMWKLKAQSARTMGATALKVGSFMSLEDKRDILSTALNALGGRTWDGKEHFITALAYIISSDLV